MTDEQRIEALVRSWQERQLQAEPLDALEQEALAAVAAVAEAETAARNAFSRFYSALMLQEVPATPAIAPTELSPEVAAATSRWVEARRVWETLVPRVLARKPRAPIRRGKRLLARPPALLPLPTTLLARDALSALFAPHVWKTAPDGGALVAQMAASQVRVEFDDVLGFGEQRAIQQIVKHGASAAQTFLALAALWQKHHPDQPHDAYLTIYASDLLRFQGRKATPRGGFHRADLLAKGRDVYFLSRISLPTVQPGGMRLGRLLSVDSLESVTDSDGQSLLSFRYHLGREVHAWTAAEGAAVSPRLLTYHPIRQKYQVLLGFCLAWYDHHRKDDAAIPLPMLLRLAAIPMPEKRLSAFLTAIEDAIADLARDGVIPGVRLHKPDGWPHLLETRRSREVIEGSYVAFPRLPRLASTDALLLPGVS